MFVKRRRNAVCAHFHELSLTDYINDNFKINLKPIVTDEHKRDFSNVLHGSRQNEIPYYRRELNKYVKIIRNRIFAFFKRIS